jgi:hypothetical protein
MKSLPSGIRNPVEGEAEREARGDGGHQGNKTLHVNRIVPHKNSQTQRRHAPVEKRLSIGYKLCLSGHILKITSNVL